MRILERCLLERENWNGRSNAQFYTAVHPHTMGLLSSREGVIFISANGLQISEGTNSVGIVQGIWAFAYLLLAAVFFSLIISTLENKLKISLKRFANSK